MAKELKNMVFKSKSRLLFIFLVLIILIFLNPVLPIGSCLFLNTLLDVDDAHMMAHEEFERQNPNLDARGSRHIYCDPLAYTIEVRGYTKSGEELILAKKEIYRIYWWGKVVKSENVVTEFLRSVNYALFD